MKSEDGQGRATALTEAEPDASYLQKVKAGWEWLVQWSRTTATQTAGAVEGAVNTVTGKAVLEKVAAYLQETEAVNTAMATRIYDLLDREAKLKQKFAAVEATNKRLKWGLAVSFVIQAIMIAYLFVSHR